jgi:hypothetical protein
MLGAANPHLSPSLTVQLIISQSLLRIARLFQRNDRFQQPLKTTHSVNASSILREFDLWLCISPHTQTDLRQFRPEWGAQIVDMIDSGVALSRKRGAT